MSPLDILIRRRVLVHTAIRELDRYLTEKRRLIRRWGGDIGLAPERRSGRSGEPKPERQACEL
jgi:hypothetical protein